MADLLAAAARLAPVARAALLAGAPRLTGVGGVVGVRLGEREPGRHEQGDGEQQGDEPHEGEPIRASRRYGRDVEIGCAVAASRWGEGLATEIARASVRVAFEELGLAEVVAFARTTNLASQRVMEKAGLRREGEFSRVELAHVLFRLRRTAC